MTDLEKVAMAICIARYGNLRGFYARREQYEKEASAALAATREALQEPTEKMLAAAEDPLCRVACGDLALGIAGDVWHDMLSASFLKGET